MPQIIPLVVTAITAVTSAVVAAGPLAVAAFNAANIIGAAALANEAFKAVQPQVKSSSTALEWNADPNAPNRFAFGRVGGPGNIIHNATYGPDKMFVGFVGVMSASGPIKSWQAFKADDAFVAFDASGKAINTEYANEMYLGRQRGLQPEPSYLPSPAGLKNGAAMPRWGASYKLSGKAAYIYTLAENSKRSAFKGKVPTGIHTIEGLYCYDPRLDSTYPGGTGPCRIDDPRTWVYSTNAYIHALNWSIGRWEGEARGFTPARYGVPYASMKVGGIGATPDGIDFSGYVEAANVFDENAWACAAWPDADQSKAAVLDSFLQAGGGIYAERQGKISCLHRAAPRTSVVTITADDTAGTIEYDTTTSLLERINTIRPEYWSEAHGWQMVATDEVTSSVWREEDGQGVAVTRSKGLAYNYVPQSKQARELAALQVAHTREGIRGTAPLRHYLDLEVGDCFTFEVPEAVLNGQKCIVLNVDPDLENDIIHVTFASESDGKYAFAFGQADAPPPAPALQPADNTVSPPLPGDWTITPRPPAPGGGQLPGFDLGGIVSNATATAIIVEYGPSAAGPWTQAYQGPPTVTNIPIDGLQPGATYYIAVQYQRNQNYSERYVYGPYTAPNLAPTHLKGEPVQDILDKLTDTATLTAANAATVADLNGRVDDTVTAAEAAIAAGEAANLAVLKAGEAGEAAQASNVAAGIATTKADEAGNSATAANAEKLAAEAARTTADDRATAAVSAAASAAASATSAGERATAADGSATTAATKAGEASTFAGQASTSAANAVAASVTAGTAATSAQGVANRLLPDRPAIGADFASAGSSLPPETIGSLTAGSVVTVAGEGDVRQFTTSTSFSSRGAIAITPGSTYRTTSRARVTANGTDNRYRSGIWAFDANWASLGSVFVWNDVAAVAAGGWKDYVTELTAAQILAQRPGAAYIRSWVQGGVNAAGAASGASWQIATLRLRDATSEVSAAAAAATAVSQSSSAGAFAAAAEISANLAATTANANPNLVPNSTGLLGMQGWGGLGATQIVAESAATDGARFVWYPATTGAADQQAGSDPLPFEGNAPVSVAAEVFASGMTGGAVRIFVAFLNAADAIIGYQVAEHYGNTTGWVPIKAEGGASPAGTAKIRVAMDTFGATWGASGRVAGWRKIKVERSAVSTPWNDIATTSALSASLNITAAVAADAQTRLSTVRFDVTGGAGGDPFQIWARADATGSAAGLVASELSFASVVGGTVVKAMKIIGGEVFFMRPIYIDVGSKRLIVGPGADWVMWFGPNTTAASAATRTNGHWAFGSDGKVYYGANELSNGGGFHAQANLGASVGTRTTAGQVTTALVTIDTSGATGAVSYAWTQISGDSGWSITSPNTASTSFRCNVSSPGEIRNAAFVCRVTDAGSGRSFNITVGAAAIYNV